VFISYILLLPSPGWSLSGGCNNRLASSSFLFLQDLINDQTSPNTKAPPTIDKTITIIKPECELLGDASVGVWSGVGVNWAAVFEDVGDEVGEVADAEGVDECAVKTACRSEGAGADHVSAVGSLQLTLKEASTLQHAHKSVVALYTISGYPCVASEVSKTNVLEEMDIRTAVCCANSTVGQRLIRAST
jgi:hypothetical protein